METDSAEGATGSGSSSNLLAPEYNLRWDEFKRVVVDSLWALLTEESLVDCTLACSPTEQVKVHRVVLSANSPYFRSILSSYSSHPHPIIILQDVRFSVLKLLVTFMYRGEVSVLPDEINSLLKTADNLQIIGLSQQTCHRLTPVSSNINSSNAIPTPPVAVPDPPEPSTVYSKKARILLDATSASSKMDVVMEPPSQPIPLQPGKSPPLDYRDREQNSPLALKKEDDDWDHHHHQQKSSNDEDDVQNEPLCLRYCCIYCSTNFPSQSALSRHIMGFHPTVYSLYHNPSTSGVAAAAAAAAAASSSAAAAVVHPAVVAAAAAAASAMDHHERDSSPEPPPSSHHYTRGGSSSGGSGEGGGRGADRATSRDYKDEDMNHSPPGPSDLEEHVGQGGGIVCKFCGKPFPEVSMLIQHLPIHTGERPFKCEFCGKAFKLRHHMKDHARVHTGERPFRCSICGKTFSRSTILKAHEKTHFPKNSAGGV